MLTDIICDYLHDHILVATQANGKDIMAALVSLLNPDIHYLGVPLIIE